MKKIITAIIIFAFAANVSAQIEVSPSENVGIGTTNPQHKLHIVGDTYVTGNMYLGSSLGTITDFPIIFKVNNVLSGFSGGTGNTNVSFGYQALSSLYGGYDNVAVGVGAMRNPFGSGWENTATGYYALYNNFEGWSNTATGRCALFYNTDGSCNTATGYYALSSNATGNNNTAVGCGADVNSPNLTNATAIGYNAKVTASNQVVLGNSAVTSASVGISVFWSTASDGRIKKNIQENVPGLAFIKHLQPVTYNIDLDVVDELERSDDPKINARRDSLRMARSPEQKEIETIARANKEKIVYTGFIAQDVEKTAKSLGYDFIGVDAPENDKGAYGLRYTAFIVPLVKAVQELSEQNDTKDAAIALLQEQFNELMLYARELNKKIEVLERK